MQICLFLKSFIFFNSGLRFGVLQTRLGLVTIIRNFRVTLNEKTIHPIKLDPKDVTMMPLGGIWLNTERI